MNTLKRKLTAILLTFAMLFSLMPALPQAAEAAQNEVSGKNECISLSYENEGALEKNITVNAILDGEIVDTISVSDAKASSNNITVAVNNPTQYEIAGWNGVSYTSNAGFPISNQVNETLSSWSATWDATANNDLVVTINLRTPLAHADIVNGVYTGGSEVDFRAYEPELLKLLYLENVDIPDNGELDIKGITLNFYESIVGYGDSESLGNTPIPGVNESNYYVGVLSNITHMASPTNIKSVTVEYEGGSKEISADKLQFVYHDGDNPYYSLESNNKETHVVYFYNQDGSDVHYLTYAVRFVADGDSLGENMPSDPDYGDLNTYVFVNWEIEDTGEPFFSNTTVTEDMAVFAQKVTSPGSGGAQIHVDNTDNELIARIVEVYNAENGTTITAQNIDHDSVTMSVSETDSTATNPDYWNNKWFIYDGNEYYRIWNMDAPLGLETLRNDHVAFNDLSTLTVYFDLNGSTSGQSVTIPIGENAGEISKSMVNDDAIIRLAVIEGPTAPTAPDLEGDDSEILGAGSVKVECSTNEDHQDGDYALLTDSYKIGNVYWDGSYEDNDGAYFVDITVNDDAYVDKYNESNGTHTLVGEGTQTIILKWTGSAWTRVTDTPVTFEVKCESEESTTPEKPGEGTVEGLLKNAVEVVCDNSEATHEVKEGKTYGLIEDGYTLAEDVTGDADNGYTYTVTIQPDAYVLQYSRDTEVDHDLDLADQENKTITLKWTGIEWQVAEGSIPVTITVHCDSEEPTPTTPEKPDADDLNDLLDVVLNCASNVGHDDRTYEDLLENSYDIGNVTHNGEGAYTVGVTINSDKYIADYSNNVVKVVHEIQDKTQATKIVTLTYDKDQETWTTAESPVKFLIVCEGVDWDISNIEKDLVTEATLGAAKTNGVSDDALKNITVPEDMDDTVIIPEDGSVTLLYAITVRGKVGIDFSVEDPGTTLIKSSANVSVDKNADVATYIGSIPENGTVTFYVSKKFTVDNITENGQLVNSATVAGDDGTTVNPGTEDDPANKDDEAIAGEEEDNRPTPPPYIPGGDDDDNLGDNDGPSGLNTEDHFSYVVGYEDGMVKPQRSITRAEVATIFYRLLEDDVRDDYDTTRNNFSDVTSDSWYNQTVSTLASMGILKGYEDGTFRPNASITRAEFAAIATRFFEETGATYEPGTFTDVTGDEWFAGAIMDAVNLGLIGGYEDGTVRPNNNITRAEACAIVNRTLGRVPDADHLLPADEMTTWPDNPSSAWFYADMQEATNGHEYEWITEDGNKIEEWTDILDKDWNDR